MNFYQGFSATFYDQFFPVIDEQELAFYTQHVKRSPMPALEVACGTGRILLPLLKQGLEVEGFDASPEMLSLCKTKAEQQQLAPVLYEQHMQQLRLPKKYGCIFSPLGSFQQVNERDDAQRALQTFYEHLLPGGTLLIYLHIPWYDASTFGDWRQHEPVFAGSTTIIVHEKSVHEPIEQRIFSMYRYELWQNNVCVSYEEKELVIRWYSRYEFEMMLEHAGFKNITVSAGYDDNGPFDVMLFCAKK